MHGFGLTRPLRAVGIDGRGTVTEVRVLRPWRLLTIPRVVWTLELPIDDPYPDVGEELNIYARRCGWQADYLWNADRQPG